jgi:hypothetical protein
MNRTDVLFVEDPWLRMLYVREPGSKIPKKFYDGRHAVLLQDFRYLVNGEIRFVPTGLLFDGGTIPRFLWEEVGGPFEYYVPAYIVHDWMCRLANAAPKKDYARLREEADDLFYFSLIALGCPRTKAKMMWLAVRAAA